ncbi:Uncharacterised protein [Raoultella terrigena]|uniref:Uncharacterized protein n=1 Tax=Raoultella terrigena TaxID=577 RepID=A0A4U9D6I9_RAOTE|nr:Uncharacterised protein [Raoultella terrigena]
MNRQRGLSSLLMVLLLLALGSLLLQGLNQQQRSLLAQNRWRNPGAARDRGRALGPAVGENANLVSGRRRRRVDGRAPKAGTSVCGYLAMRQRC